MNRLQQVVVLLVSLSLASSARGGVLSERPCTRGEEPAATLLFPYFEVDLADPNGVTTLLSVTNSRQGPTLAKVVVWSDWALPVLSFDLYLTGFDVQTLNLRDVLRGDIPTTGSGASPRGNRSDPNLGFAGCDPENVDGSAIDVAFVQAALTGGEIGGRCWSSPTNTPSRATGYVTVDAVSRCSALLPGDDGYFGAGGTGVAANHNVLLGDAFYVHPDGDLAQGQTAVHLVADPDFFGPGDETFYARYVSTSGADARIPLSDGYGVRYLKGGGFDAGTELIVWRGITGEAPREAPSCQLGGSRLLAPSWLTHLELKIVFDEEENAVVLDSPISDSPAFVQATQKVPFFEQSPWSFGWADMSLGGQAWVGATATAEGRYSVGVEAWTLADPCSAD